VGDKILAHGKEHIAIEEIYKTSINILALKDKIIYALMHQMPMHILNLVPPSTLISKVPLSCFTRD